MRRPFPTLTIFDSRLKTSLVLLASAALWIPGLRGNYFLSDDFNLILRWGMSPLWPWFSTEAMGYYRPLVAALFRADYLLWGLNPIGYYLTNLILHVGNTFLVWKLGRTLSPDRPDLAVWGALLFLFLPGHVFAVLWVSARGDLICSVFYVLSMILYLEARKGRRFAGPGSAVSFSLALLSKELAISLPILVAVWESVICYSERRLNAFRTIRVAFPYFAILGIYLVCRWESFGHLPASPLHSNFALFHLLMNSATYGAKVFAPWGLEALKPIVKAYPTVVLVSLSILVLMFAALCWSRRHNVPMAYLILGVWFPVAILPVVRLYSPWNSYLPSVGCALLLGGILRGTDHARRTGEDMGIDPQRSKLRSNLDVRFWKKLFLAFFLCLSVSYSLSHQLHWRTAGLLCRRFLDETKLIPAISSSGGVYIANLPVEVGEAPVFGGDWGLHGALRLLGLNTDVGVLAHVRSADAHAPVETRITGERTFEMEIIRKEDFFRLESVDVLSRRTKPTTGFRYAKDGFELEVSSLNAAGEPNRLRIRTPNEEDMKKVYIWTGKKIAPLTEL